MLIAILRAQVLSLQGRNGRGLRVSTVFSIITSLLFIGVFAFLGFALMLLFSSPEEAGTFVPALSGILLVMMLYWQLAPVMSASFGASIDVRKLRVYPIPHRKLFIAELTMRGCGAFDVLLILTGIGAGLLQNPLYGAAAAPFVIPGILLFAAMNILLSVGVKSWLERFFVRGRLKEVIFFIIAMTGVLPQILRLSGVRPSGALLRFVPSNVIWPWAAAGRLLLHDAPLPAALNLAVWAGAALLFSRWQFERMLRHDGDASAGKEKDKSPGGFLEKVFRLPSRFFGDPLAALIEKELRTLSRIGRFRMAYGMSCIFGILVFTPTLRRAPDSPFMQYALPLMAVYGLLMLGQVTYWNSFGFDRSAAQGYFCWPVRFRDALIAKNLTVMALVVPQLMLISLVGRLFHIVSSPAKILEAFVVVTIAALFWLGLGNIFSVRMPRAMNADKLNQGSNKLQAMTIFIAPVVLLPVVLAYWARSVFSSEIVFAGILAVAAILGAIFYGVALDSAVNTAITRRETMLLELSRADGPISVN